MPDGSIGFRWQVGTEALPPHCLGHVGYAVVPWKQRRGYATEGASALLDHGFTTVGLHEVWAETMAVNEPSRRVMTKLGMRHLRTDHRSWEEPLPGAEQGDVVYKITREEWASGVTFPTLLRLV